MFKIFCFISIIFSLVLILNESVYYAFHFRVMNTLSVFGFSDIQIGSTIDPRTETVWPNFLAALSGAGTWGALVGFPYDGPTDSGYLAIIRESGFIGMCILFFLALFIVLKSRYDPVSLVMLFVLCVGMLFHPVQQGYRLVFFTAMFFASRIHSVNTRVNNV
ncbi:hypothetical protein OAB29_05140, partial [Oceanospirillaceae bacterium]|nr:hypothetical protein [Oceanospirillaceae bacterium]